MAGKRVIHVCGWAGCKWYRHAAELAKTIAFLYPSKFDCTLKENESRDVYKEALPVYRASVAGFERAQKHTASPFVFYEQDGLPYFVGGCDDTVAWSREILAEEAGGASKAKEAKMVADGFTKDHGYDYDVVVIGGGSGGLATSKECARLGAKTACLDYVKPSPAGSSWGLGGTCVNVGCIPKKLMHTASIIGSTIADDAKAFGFEASAKGSHSWPLMRANVQNYIKSLNFKYRVALREAEVTYLNALGAFKDAHTLELTDKKGGKTVVTAARFVVAVGGRPTQLGCQGAEHAIDSDDVFMLEKAPGRTLCVGGGYVSLECGGFLAGLGYPVTAMVRSIALRGFDRECVDKITEHMGHHGMTLQYGVTPAKIEKLNSGALLVTDSQGGTAEYDTVLVAVGRTPDLGAGLGIANVPGAAEAVDPKSKKIKVSDEQVTSAPHVYAIGDVVQGAPELTPVAIEAGLRLANRLFGSSSAAMDYENVATTIFTPLEYGTIGLTEEEAKSSMGDENVEVYISEFAPLEYALSEQRQDRGDGAFAKVLVDKTTDKVVGFHYLGPNAGEITQGFSVAMRKGATYADFKATVGIHPTVAEEFTSISVTKSSGLSAAKGGC